MAASSTRVSFKAVEGSKEVVTPEFIELVVTAHDKFSYRVQDIRTKREAMLERAIKHGIMPDFLPPSEATTGDWQVPPVPEDLLQPGIEISGPVSIASSSSLHRSSLYE